MGANMGEQIDQRAFGRLEGNVESLSEKIEKVEKQMDSMGVNVQAMRDLMEQSKGGWKVLAWVGGLTGVVGAMLAKIASHIPAWLT